MCHWDIKPENLMFEENMELQIVDFGTSKFVRGGIDWEEYKGKESFKETTSTGA